MKSTHKPLIKSTGEMGFTLIELSIVLVIIGLIIGGVLVGQDLIKAAETRATLAQIEKYNSAVNTFRNKYNGLPGDLLNAYSTFGLPGGAGGTGDRDGNGFVEGCAALAIATGCETLYFWSDMQTAGFLDASVSNGASGSTKLALLSVTSGSVQAAYWPPAKLGKGNYVMVFYNLGYNWFGVGNFTSASGAFTAGQGLTPNQAFNMDKKVDDGLPMSGIVQAVLQGALTGGATATTWGTDTAGAADGCIPTGQTTYNLNTSTGDVAKCSIEMRFN